MAPVWLSLAAIAVAYLLGCFPTAYVLGRRRGVDIREVGDHNMGAANAYRELGPGEGFAVLALDAAKGMAAVLVAQRLGVPEWAVLASGWVAVMGHNWPFFLHFRGGRGASTALGVLAILFPRPFVLVAGAGLVTLLITWNTTWASAAVFAPLPFVAWALDAPTSLVLYAALLPCLVGFTHYLRTRGTRAEERAASS